MSSEADLSENLLGKVPQQKRELLERCGALTSGHFLLTSGRHSPFYFQGMRVVEQPSLALAIAREVIAQIEAAGEIDLAECRTTLAPALGGITWGFALAAALQERVGSAARMSAYFAERIDHGGGEAGSLTLRRGFHLRGGEPVLLAEDVITTGGTVAELAELARGIDARVIGVAAVLDRSGDQEYRFKDPLQAWVKLNIPTYEAGDCPLCKAGGAPPVKPGSRKIT